MNLQIYWLNPEKTIIQMDLNSGWTWHDVKLAAVPYLEMMESVSHKVDLLMVVKDNRIPPNALANVNHLLRLTHPREGKMIIVGHLPLAAPLLGILGKVYGLSFFVQNIRIVDTVEEALAILEANPHKEYLPVDG